MVFNGGYEKPWGTREIATQGKPYIKRFIYILLQVI